MKRSYALALLVILLSAGCTDFTPRIPKDQAQKTLEKWLKDYGLPDTIRGFDKGQQGQVTVTEVYGYGYAPDVSYAKLRFEDFKYKEQGETKSFTGKGQLTFHKEGDGKWVIQRMAFEGEHDEILQEFYPSRKVEVEQL